MIFLSKQIFTYLGHQSKFDDINIIFWGHLKVVLGWFVLFLLIGKKNAVGFLQEEKEVVFALQKDLSNKFSSECLHIFVCLFTFFVFVFSSLFKTFKELEKRLMHCEYHHCISASQSSEWFMICSNIFFLPKGQVKSE